MLTVDVYQQLSDLFEDGDVHAPGIDSGDTSAVASDLTGKEQLTVLTFNSELGKLGGSIAADTVKHRGDRGFISARPDDILGDPLTEHGVDTVYQY